MSDDKSKVGEGDRRRISLEEDYEVSDWAQKYGVTAAELREAVEKVGTEAQRSRRTCLSDSRGSGWTASGRTSTGP